MTLPLAKRATLLTTLTLFIATLAPVGALAADDHAKDKAQCVSEKDARPWDCIEDAPGMTVAPPAGSEEAQPIGPNQNGLDYAQAGNNLPFETLGTLHDQLGGMKQGLTALAEVQQLHNEIAPSSFQANLDTAVVVSQTVNDVMKEDLRRRMFEYEEFIKSASSIMAKITQIIEKMATGLRG